MKSYSDPGDAQIEVFLFKYLCASYDFYPLVSIQKRHKEAKAKQKRQKEGTECSDLVMKHYGRKQCF